VVTASAVEGHTVFMAVSTNASDQQLGVVTRPSWTITTDLPHARRRQVGALDHPEQRGHGRPSDRSGVLAHHLDADGGVVRRRAERVVIHRLADQPREMDLSLTYIALASGKVDLIAGNSTEGRIAALDLFQLEDDRHYFPPYEAIYLVRKDVLEHSPILASVLTKLGNAISTEEMRRLNYEVDGKKRGQTEVVREWIKTKGL